jgi:Glycosyl transferase family 11
MIIVRLSGGMGNQMFQYAAGLSLSTARKTDLFLDLSWFHNSPADVAKRAYRLDVFAIRAGIAQNKQIRRIAEPSAIRRLFDRSKPYFRKNIYYEPHFHYDPNFRRASSDIILDGYWQSEAYFRDMADTIRREFTISAPLTPATTGMAKKIGAVNSVSLHIRRGDYVTAPQTLKYHGTCEPDYYRSAVGKIRELAGDMEIFVFSDDMDWVKENISTEFPMTFVNHPGRQDYEDLYLMSLCRHNIIANSSFSWWGAWLNKNPGKAVVAPARWFNESNADTKDLLPGEWLKV